MSPSRREGAVKAEEVRHSGAERDAVRPAILILAAATIAAFAGSLGNELVGWDDQQNLVRNASYRGLSLDHLRWMFTTGFGGHYQPLTWLSFAVESQLLWGVNAAGFHFTNLLLHTATAIGFFFVVKRLLRAALPTGDSRGIVVGALAAALLFAVHPLRVESVAWATERRDVLSGAWLMAAVIFYLRAVDPQSHARRGGAFALSLVCYVLSLLSKASAMTLPVVLLLLDIYPLRRFSNKTNPEPGRTLLRVLWEKAVFAIPAAATALLALWAQGEAGALRGISDHPLGLRIGQAFYGIVFYIAKSLWPVGLIPLYEQRPEATTIEAVNALSGGLVVGLTVLLWTLRRRAPGLLTAWVVYIVLLSPVLGLAQAGPQVVADRYSYLPCMAWAALLGGGVTRLWNPTRRPIPLPGGEGRVRAWRIALCSGLTLIAGSLILLSRAQVRIWVDTYTLWQTVVERAPNTPTAHANLAMELNARGDFAGAADHSRLALDRLPGNRTAHAALARASLELGDLETAERHHRIALAISERVGKTDTVTMIGLAIVETRLGRLDEAERTYRAVIDLEPSVAEWHLDLAGFLASQSRYEEAAAAFARALTLDPERIEAYSRLGIILMNLHKPGQAIRCWEEGLTRAPQDVPLRAELAWVLATCAEDSLRDGARALTLARGAVQDSGGKSEKAREALAAALAETGDFPGAAAALEQLMSDPSRVKTEATTDRLREQFDAYRKRELLRE
jgi:tetratricopeptide (TPR) repeat protein